jgi:ATP-dependent DNA helicase 2 subunit 2
MPNYNGQTTAYLTMIQLPFAEDEISFMFPPLKGARTKPSVEQLDAIDKLIDTMDLMTALDDESGLQEACDTKKTLNPLHQHVCRSICHRALNPTSELSKIEDELLKIIDVPEKLKEASRDAVETIKGLFELEEVKIPIKKIFPVTKDGDEPVADQDDQELDLAGRSDIVEVGTITPAEDFYLLLHKKGEHFGKVAGQIQNVIYDLIFRTTNLQLEKVSGALHIYREEAKNLGPFYYNEWIPELKDALISRNRLFLFEDVIVKENYGLISESESKLSSVSEEIVKEFYKAVIKKTVDVPMVQDDDDDLDRLLED